MSPAFLLAILLATSPAIEGAPSEPSVQDVESPRFLYELDTRREIALSASGIIALGLSGILYQEIEPLSEEEIAALDPGDVIPFDRSATEKWDPTLAQVSDVLVWTLLLSPTAFAFVEPGSEHIGVLGAMYGETLLLNNGIVNLIKVGTQRSRPYVYNDDPAISDESKQSTEARRSFPSGHTANAFAAAIFLSSVHSRLYPDSSARPWIWGGSLLMASVTGYLRYESGRHYPTDVIFGAIIGASIGYLVPKLHESSLPVQVGTTPDGRSPALSLRIGI